MKARMTSWLNRFRRDQSGNVLIITGATILVLLAVSGAAVDLGRQQIVRMKLQQASDAGALAGALAKDGADRESTAMRYFNLNFPPTYLGIARPTPTVTLGANTIEVQAQLAVTPVFMKFVGMTTMNAAGDSLVNTSNVAAPTPYDVLLVMDNSWSMSAADVGSGNTSPVPDALITASATAAQGACFAQYGIADLCSVCIANGPTNFSDPTTCSGYTTHSPSGYGLTGETRINALRHAALSITDQLLGPDGTPGSRMGVVTWSGSLYNAQPLTTDIAIPTATINQMFAWGATNSTLGLTKAKEFGVDFDYNHVRVLVLLTDGMNTISGPIDPATGTDANGCYGSSAHYCDAASQASLQICDYLKSTDTKIYTIAFGQDAVSGAQAAHAQEFLNGCASDDPDNPGGKLSFTAPDAETLQRVTQTILQSVKKVKISK